MGAVVNEGLAENTAMTFQHLLFLLLYQVELYVAIDSSAPVRRSNNIKSNPMP